MSRRFNNAAFVAAWQNPALTTDEIAAMFGVRRSSVSRMGQVRGLPPRKAGPKPTYDAARFKALWLAGVAASDIAADLGISRNYTTVLAKHLGLQKRPQGGWKPVSLADYRAAQLLEAMAAAARVEQAAALAMWRAA